MSSACPCYGEPNQDQGVPSQYDTEWYHIGYQSVRPVEHMPEPVHIWSTAARIAI